MAGPDLEQELERELERLHPKSFAWTIVCCGGDRHEAEDVLQSAYLKVLDGRARFAGHSSLKTWLFAVIRRTAAGRRRRRTTRRWLLARWSGDPSRPRPVDGPEERLGRRERDRRVLAALDALSPRQRQILELVFYHDLSVREAAAVIGVSAGSASVHYDRGKRALLARLGPHEAPGVTNR